MSSEKYVASILFENKLLQSDGKVFEDLVTRLFSVRYPSFIKIKPYGNIGDEKNDGYIPNEGRYFQIYGPEDIAKSFTQTDLIKKLSTDFVGLVSHWQQSAPIKAFDFVLNEKHKGVPPAAAHAMDTLRNSYPDVIFQFLTTLKIIGIFNELSNQQMTEVIGYIPLSYNIEDVSYSMFSKIINFIISNCKPIKFGTDYLNSTEFEEKILFNGLDEASSFLKIGSLQVGTVETFISENAVMTINLVKDCFVALYEESIIEFPDTIENAPDKRFFYIADRAVPTGEFKDKRIQDAIFVLMSYFFETCDIYKTKQASI